MTINNNTMKYLALSQMCSIFTPLVLMHAGLLQHSAQESTKEMVSFLAFKNACIFVLKKLGKKGLQCFS